MKTSKQLQKKQKKLKTLLVTYPTLIPVYVSLANMQLSDKQYFIFAVQTKQTFLQFKQTIKAKLLYNGGQQKKALFYYVHNQGKNKKQMISNFGMEIGEMYDRYKSHQGWLELLVGIQSFF